MTILTGAGAKAAAAALSSDNLRKGVGWILVAVFSPLIILIAVLCSLGTSSAAHNNQVVAATFYGGSYSEKIPVEFQHHVEEMRTAFSRLDAAVASVSEQMDSGSKYQ